MTQKRLLVVDDEEALLALMVRFLARSGFDVTPACDGEQAWTEMEKSHSDYSLVVLDLTLPGLSGLDLLAKIREQSPRVAVLLLSGYPFDTGSLPEHLRENVRFVQKPFSPKTLVVLIEEILN